MSTFSQYTMEELMYETPLLTVFVLESWAISNDPINRFGGIRMINGGFSGMEADKLYKELL